MKKSKPFTLIAAAALAAAAIPTSAASGAAASPAPSNVTKTCHAQSGMFPQICVSVAKSLPADGSPNITVKFVGASWYWKHHAMDKLTIGLAGTTPAPLAYASANAANSAYTAAVREAAPGTYSFTIKMKMYGYLPHVETLSVVVPS